MRTCRLCGYEGDAFYAKGNVCKRCVRERRKARYYEDPERARAASREWHHENRERANARRQECYRREHPEVQRVHGRSDEEKALLLAAAKRRWAQANPEMVRAQKRRSYARNRERLLAERRAQNADDPKPNRQRVRAWAQANPEKVRAAKQRSQAARRARKLGAFVEQVDRAVVFEVAGGLCGVCMEPVDPQDFHVDHIVPLSRGGEHSYANTQPAHPRCNMEKGARLECIAAGS